MTRVYQYASFNFFVLQAKAVLYHCRLIVGVSVSVVFITISVVLAIVLTLTLTSEDDKGYRYNEAAVAADNTICSEAGRCEAVTFTWEENYKEGMVTTLKNAAQRCLGPNIASWMIL